MIDWLAMRIALVTACLVLIVAACVYVPRAQTGIVGSSEVTPPPSPASATVPVFDVNNAGAAQIEIVEQSTCGKPIRNQMVLPGNTSVSIPVDVSHCLIRHHREKIYFTVGQLLNREKQCRVNVHFTGPKGYEFHASRKYGIPGLCVLSNVTPMQANLRFVTP